MKRSRAIVIATLPVYALLWGVIFYWKPYEFWWSISVISALVIAASSAIGAREGALKSWFRVTVDRIGLGVAVGVGLYLVFFVGFAGLNLLWPAFTTTQVASLYGMTVGMSPGVLTLLLTALVIPGEEFYWRGVVQPAVVERLGPRGGIAMAALLYAAVNGWSGNPLQVLAGVVCGGVWGWTAWRTGGLVAPLIAHLLWDLALLIWFPLYEGPPPVP